MGFLTKYRNPIVVFLLVLLPLAFFVSNSKDARDHNVVDRVVVTLSSPIQWLVVVTLGPLTNLALALARAPDLVGSVGRCVVMGGRRAPWAT